MNYPEGLLYSKSDEWVRVEGDVATIGITDYAQHELGDIVYVELPEVGSRIARGAAFGVVESVKAVSDLVTPVAGEVVEANLALTDDPGEPGAVNTSPYGDGWLVKIKLDGPAPAAGGDLMDALAYAAYRAS